MIYNKHHNGSVIGQYVKINGIEKHFAPNSGKNKTTYGFVVDVCDYGFGVVYAWEDGEYTEAVVKPHQLEVCESVTDIEFANESAVRWLEATEHKLIERLKKAEQDGDYIAYNNLKKRRHWCHMIFRKS